jgi:DUF3037 family protein
MAEEARRTYLYRVLRYAPNLIRDEWVNIGVLLEEVEADDHPATAEAGRPRRAVRLIEESSEIARVRRLHPNADEDLLRALPADFEARFRAPAAEVAAYIERLDQTLSNVLQFGPQKALLAEDFDAELDRLYGDHVAAPARARGEFFESTRAWIKAQVNDFFRRRVPRLERNIRVEEFTQPGDPLKIDYGYQNGARGYLHVVALGRDPSQAKVLAYTAERIRERVRDCEFTAITEVEPIPGNPRHQFIKGLFEAQGIGIVPLNRIDTFADDLRERLQ